MGDLVLVLERTAPFRRVEDAVDPIVAISGVVAEARDLDGPLTFFRGEAFDLTDRGDVAFLLDEGAGRTLDDTDPTHVFPILSPDGERTEIGALYMAIGEDAANAGALGVRVELSLDERSSAAALQALLSRGVSAISADWALIGPSSWVREVGAGWITFSKAPAKAPLPPAAVSLAAPDGVIVVSHAEAPSSESAEALDLAQDVLAAFRGSLSPETAGTEPHAAPDDDPDAQRRASGSSPPRELPTYLLDPAPTVETMGTVQIDPAKVRRPVLPFSARQPDSSRPDGEGVSVPDLTLEQYAVFRAELLLSGEDDARTWAAFGVTSRAAKDALRDRFAAIFRSDLAAQSRFVDIVRRVSGRSEDTAEPPLAAKPER